MENMTHRSCTYTQPTRINRENQTLFFSKWCISQNKAKIVILTFLMIVTFKSRTLKVGILYGKRTFIHCHYVEKQMLQSKQVKRQTTIKIEMLITANLDINYFTTVNVIDVKFGLQHFIYYYIILSAQQYGFYTYCMRKV